MCVMHQQQKKLYKITSIKIFRRKESVLNQNRGASGRPVRVRIKEKIEAVSISF